ncbi:monooxygenase 2-like isoform X2 [Rhododendron vialii]|uniref:monooxygenase 2-like isoform X2 n=1 Tax=Rhododendron vialii TaxID=182163 RepID=UPI00265ECAAC|nr:monooxygenase 2-like isoform X2 [Rhododendron vialii]
MQEIMEIEEDIVIVGGGIAGLTTALGLHRLGLRSLVLESSEGLRIAGFALTLWANAWRALDAVGIGNSLREHYPLITRLQVTSSVSGVTSEIEPPDKQGGYEGRCVRRKELLETLERELPHGTIRYSSKVVSIEDMGYHKLLHLVDGSTLKTKVLIGCDGVNSSVAKWLGLQKPVYSGRSAMRGFVQYPDGHGFQPRFHVYFEGGIRYGYLPCDDKCLYWFCTFNSSLQHDEDMQENPAKMKQFVLSKISHLPQRAAAVVELTELDSISCAPLKLRLPWNLLLGNISKGNVCVAGDALHPMTPDIGQGGCSALEDSVVLARCLAEALLKKPRNVIQNEEEEYVRIEKGLEKFAKERRWRSFSLISAAYVVGFIQETDGKVMRFLREKFLSRFTASSVWKMADFHCGELNISGSD